MTETPLEAHDWFVPDFIGYECCRKCGIVRRADGKNKPCRGVVKIALRAQEQRMRSALETAAAQFELYVVLHRAKNPPDEVKAGTNERMAAMCRAALEG